MMVLIPTAEMDRAKTGPNNCNGCTVIRTFLKLNQNLLNLTLFGKLNQLSSRNQFQVCSMHIQPLKFFQKIQYSTTISRRTEGYTPFLGTGQGFINYDRKNSFIQIKDFNKRKRKIYNKEKNYIT